MPPICKGGFSSNLEASTILLELNNATMTYYEGEESQPFVFRDANLILSGKGLFAIAGRSGSGKSSIVRVLLGLHTLNEGSLRLNGVEADASALRDCSSYVSQDPEFFNDTIINNLLLDKDVGPDVFDSVLEKLGLLKLIADLPNGYNTVVNEIANFSGGERRRLALARAIHSDRPILFLDEITAGLDDANAHSLINLLHEFSRNKEVAHNFWTATLHD